MSGDNRSFRKYDPSTEEPVMAARGPTGLPTIASDRGFTLVEAIIVAALMAIAAMVITFNIPEMHRRYVLEAEMRHLTSFFRDVPTTARQLNTPVFITWDNANRRFITSTDVAAANVLDTFTLTDEIGITPPGNTVFRCDLFGRAFVGNSPTMMTAVETVILSHLFASGGTPSFQLTLTPLWTVSTVPV